MRPTVKPVAIIAMRSRLLTQKRIVLDCFGGSGTTLIAAEQTGRRARLIELDPIYVDVIIRRYEAAGLGYGKAVLSEMVAHSAEVCAQEGNHRQGRFEIQRGPAAA